MDRLDFTAIAHEGLAFMNPLPDEEIDETIEVLELEPGARILDLGCGTGFMARAQLCLAARLILVDGSPGMLEEARTRLGPLPSGSAVELRQGELDRLPFADRELDGAVCGLVLHHLPELGPPLARPATP